jgi:hypothetical protein
LKAKERKRPKRLLLLGRRERKDGERARRTREIDVDRRSRPSLPMRRRRQRRVRRQRTLLTSLQPRDFPDDHVLPLIPLCLPQSDVNLDAGRVERGRDPEDDAVGVELGVEVCAKVDGVFDFGFGGFGDDRMEAEREVDVCRGAVS